MAGGPPGRAQGFHSIRHYGLFASAGRKDNLEAYYDMKLDMFRRMLGDPATA